MEGDVGAENKADSQASRGGNAHLEQQSQSTVSGDEKLPLEVEQLFQQLQTTQSVQNVAILTSDGQLLKSSFRGKQPGVFMKQILQLFDTSNYHLLKQIDQHDELQLIRVQSASKLLFLAQQQQYIVVCLQEK